MTGGSGSYQWSCDVVGIVGVSSTGLLTTKTKGNTLVVAVDTKNTAHFDKTEVYVEEIHVYKSKVLHIKIIIIIV